MGKRWVGAEVTKADKSFNKIQHIPAECVTGCNRMIKKILVKMKNKGGISKCIKC